MIPQKGPKKLPSCTAIFDRFWYCASPGSQFSHYYRNGEIESCAVYLSDWGSCLKSQLVWDETRKREILAGTQAMDKIDGNPNKVLQTKEISGWGGR